VLGGIAPRAAVALLTATTSPASFCLRAPPSAALDGAEVCLQGAALQSGNCLVLTDRLKATLVQ
jgi:hypothetical protein